MITVVDGGIGNIGAILNMLRHQGIAARSSADPREVRDAAQLILPGIGSFDNGISRLAERGLVDALHDAVLERRVPVLGICLGMHLMLEGSAEGRLPGLGWIKGRCVRFDLSESHPDLRVPHMGWADVAVRRACALFPDRSARQRFYFVHSYHARCADPAAVVGTARYGHDFAAAIEQGNLFGTQFHPEKSHKYGMALLTAFAGAGMECREPA